MDGAVADAGLERYAERVRAQLGVPGALVTLRSMDVVEKELASAPEIVAATSVPLTDDEGAVIGTVAAFDTAPRSWSADDMRLLDELARDCSNELGLRRLRSEVARSRRLLALAESLGDARTEEGVLGRLERLARSSPGLSGIRLHRIAELSGAGPIGSHLLRCARDLEPVLDVELSRLCVPVIGSDGTALGVLELGWSDPPDVEDVDQARTLASYVTMALERARLIERRIGVANQLQAAMLTTLPDLTDLEIAGTYVAAAAEEWVGGDWYDAIVLPPDSEEHDLIVAITVGDVIGHDIEAAALMGQARAMLRQAAFDRPGQGPADVLSHFEMACAALGVAARGSAVLAYFERSAATGSWRMRWTSAGHPPPLVAQPDGSLVRLQPTAEEQDMLFGYPDLHDLGRHDSLLELAPGTTILFYTDGVIEVPGLDLDIQMDELGDLLAAEHRRGPRAVVDAISMNFGTGYDDLVALAVRVPEAPSSAEPV